jgi:hypothetical protein
MDLIEQLWNDYEREITEKKIREKQAKEYKDAMIEEMNNRGIDEKIVNGVEGLVKLMIVREEKKVLNKKELAEVLGVKQKYLNDPQMIIQLTLDGKLDKDTIIRYTYDEVQELFKTKDIKEENEDDE